MIFMSGKGVLVATTEELVCEIPLMDALIPDKEVETSNTKLEKATNKASCKHSASRPCLPIASLGTRILINAYKVSDRSCWVLCISLFHHSLLTQKSLIMKLRSDGTEQLFS